MEQIYISSPSWGRCFLSNQSLKRPISNSLGENRFGHLCFHHQLKSFPHCACLRNSFHILAVSSESPESSLLAEADTKFDGYNRNQNKNSEDEMLKALKERRTEEAWKLLGQLEELPGSTCLSRLVAQLSYQGTPTSLSRAQTIVKRLRNEKLLHRLDCNSLGLLAMAAAKTGIPQYGATIIDLMLKLGYFPHVKAWSAVLSRLGKCPHGLDPAFQLFHSICERIREVEKLVDSVDVIAHMKPDTGAFNAILNACAIAGNTEKAEELTKEMHLFGVKHDVLTFNIMIKLYARVERKESLVTVIEKMLEENIEPCITTFRSLVAAYVGFGDLEMAERLVQAMRDGRRDLCSILSETDARHDPSNEIAQDNPSNEMVTDSKANVSTARLLLTRTYKPDSWIYTILMKGYMQKGRLNDVLQTLKAMQNDSQSHPDEVTYTTAISAFVKMGLMDEACAVLQEMAAKEAPANLITYNILLNGYCRLLQMQKAEVLMQDMKDAGIVPDVVSYNTLINGCIRIDDNVGALTYFNEMRKAGIAPSNISYTTLMKAFGMNGQPRLAAKVFEEMQKDPRIRVDIVAWNMLIESYSRVGLIEDAKKVFQQMKEQNLHPTVATYGSLVNGFARAQKPGEALVLWNEIKERTMAKSGEGGIEPLEPDEGLFNSLVDICVREAFFSKALEMVACMEQHKIPANKTKYKRMFVELHSMIYTSKHASKARQDRRSAKKRAAEAFKFWLGLPNSYFESEWRPESRNKVE
eukprot:Gb_16885 [translate_table: standard]